MRGSNPNPNPCPMDIELRSGIDTEKRVGEDSLHCGSYLSNQSNNTNRDNHVNAPKIIKKKKNRNIPSHVSRSSCSSVLSSHPNSLFSLLTHFIPSLTHPSPTPTCLCFLGFLYPPHFNPPYLSISIPIPSFYLKPPSLFLFLFKPPSIFPLFSSGFFSPFNQTIKPRILSLTHDKWGSFKIKPFGFELQVKKKKEREGQ